MKIKRFLEFLPYLLQALVYVTFGFGRLILLTHGRGLRPCYIIHIYV